MCISLVKAIRLGSGVEWRRGGRAGNCCCGASPPLPNHYHHTFHIRFFSGGGKHLKRSGRVERAKCGKILNSRESLVDFLFAQDGLLHAAGIRPTDLGGQIPGQTNAGPVNDLTHLFDDQVEVLVSIRGACRERRNARPPRHGPEAC